MDQSFYRIGDRVNKKRSMEVGEWGRNVGLDVWEEGNFFGMYMTLYGETIGYTVSSKIYVNEAFQCVHHI